MRRIASIVVLLLAAGAVRAQDAPPKQDGPPAQDGREARSERKAKVVDVRQVEGFGTSVLIDVGASAGVAVGLTVEVRRDGKAVGYGSIDTVFADVAVATIGTVVQGGGPLKTGDDVIVRGTGFRRPDPPAAEPPAGKGKVASVRDALVLLDLEAGNTIEVGSEMIVVGADGHERGRISMELVHGTTAGGMLISGSAQAGDQVLASRRARGPIDYVALSFLGVVADLEHPAPHRSPCHIGVPVRRVMPQSPAQRGGIGPGDRVVAIDGIVVRDPGAIRDRIEARDRERVKVTLLRGDRLVDVEVVFR
jgi:hypothetical protein